LGRDEPILLGTVHPNPAFHTNRCHTDLVKNATYKNSTKQDSTDDIEVLSFPLSEIPRLIHDGKTSHALVVAAFYWSFSIAGFKNCQPASEEVREKFGINLFLHTSRRIWGER
jgi:hypothetical protein